MTEPSPRKRRKKPYKKDRPRPLEPVKPLTDEKKDGDGFFATRLGLDALDYTIPKHANTLAYALGGTAFIAFLLLIASGALMTQLYNPAVDTAHESIRYIGEKATLGWFVRGIHHWAAFVMFALVLVHLVRIIITGSYKKPREITYYIGLLLLLLTFTMVATGTIVKWDQEGFEALIHLVAISGMLGFFGQVFDAALTPSTHILSRIYALHISIIPLAIVVLLVVHFYLIKVLKISPIPWKSTSEQNETSSYKQHIRLLLKTGLAVTAFIMILALLFRPPIAAAPVNMETGIKPPWLFLWIYALENQIGLVGVLYGVIAVFGVLASLPLIDRSPESHPGKRRAVMIIFGVLVAALIGLSILGYISPPVVHSEM